MQPKVYAAIDTETTSISGFMVELACVILDERLNIVFSKKWILNPLAEIDPGAAKVHGYGITKEIGTQTFEEIRKEYFALLETADKILVYQRHFEWNVLMNECNRCGIPQPIDVKDKFVDVLQMARNLLKLQRHKLSDVMAHLGIQQDSGELHGALPDAIYTAKIYRRLVTGDYTTGAETKKSPALNSEAKKSTVIEMDDFVAAASRRATALKSASEKIKVNSTKSAEAAINFASTILGLISETEKQRTEILRPLKSTVSEIESNVRASVLVPLNSILSTLRTKIEAQCMKMHSEEIMRLEIENDSDELEISSSPEDLASVLAEMAADKYSKPVSIKLGANCDVGFSPVIKVIDPDAVSRAFCSPDIEMISRFVQKSGPLTKIDGCEITYSPVIKLAKKTKKGE